MQILLLVTVFMTVVAGAVGLRHGLTGLVDGLRGGIAPGLAIGAAVAVSIAVVDSDTNRAVTPTALLREDRVAALTNSLAFAVVGVLAVGRVLGVGGGAVFGAVAGIVFGLGMNASPVFWWTRLTLALRLQTPLRLMSFLAEARDRGVLRQAGGVYQFRHARLQEQLADAVPAGPPLATTPNRAATEPGPEP
jgi:hypothetical protein